MRYSLYISSEAFYMNSLFIGILVLGILRPVAGVRKNSGPREELERLRMELRAEPQQINTYTTFDQTYDSGYAARSPSTTTTTTPPVKKRGFLR